VLRPRRPGGLDNIVSPVLHADGRILAAGGGHQLCFFDLASGEELNSVQLPLANGARPVFFDPPRLAQGEPDGQSGLADNRSGGWVTGGHSGLLLWPARQETARPEVLHIGPPQEIAPNPGGGFSSGASASADGRVVAVPQGHSTLVLYRDRPDRRVVLGPQYDVRHSAVSPDGRWVVTCSWGWDGRSKTIRIWDADTGLPVHDLAQEGGTSAKFSLDGRWLMTTAGSSGPRQWEVGAWREVRRFDRGKFVFSPNSELLAINDVFGVIRLLETTTGREVARLTGPDPTWYAPACFTPDGTRLVATCSSETALYVWDLRLIRQQLKELGLDWQWPDFPPAESGSYAAKPLQVEVLAGDLAMPVLNREAKARQDIERCRLAIAANPDDAEACNNLAWQYVTAPEALRDVKGALPLAETAVRLEPGKPLYRNTLGVAYYRDGRYREAAEVLRANLDKEEDWGLPFDLYFLAMSHHRLGETARARDFFDWAVRWTQAQRGLSAGHLDELTTFRAEAEELLKQESGAKSQEPENTEKPK
jgi:WD40 repeat protein